MNASSSGEYNEMLVHLAKNSTGEERRAALDLLCRKNQGLIRFVVKPFASFTDPEELSQEAALAMIRAVDNYDPAQGSFSSFMTACMRNAILNYLNHQENQTLKISVSKHVQILAYQKICEQYQQKYDRRPTDMEAAILLECSIETIEEIRKATRLCKTRSLSEVISPSDGDDITLEESIPDPRDRIGELEDEIQASQLSAELSRVVDSVLDDREKLVIRARYYDGKTLLQTGEALGGLSVESARKIEQKALVKMRRSSRSKALLDYFYLDGMKRTGLTSYLSTWTSATERTAMRIYEHKQKRRRAI